VVWWLTTLSYFCNRIPIGSFIIQPAASSKRHQNKRRQRAKQKTKKIRQAQRNSKAKYEKLSTLELSASLISRQFWESAGFVLFF
jgi:hypothetical protein